MVLCYLHLGSKGWEVVIQSKIYQNNKNYQKMKKNVNKYCKALQKYGVLPLD